MPFIFSFRIKFKVCFIFLRDTAAKEYVVFYINPSYFVFIKVSFFKEKSHNIYLIDFIFLAFSYI